MTLHVPPHTLGWVQVGPRIWERPDGVVVHLWDDTVRIPDNPRDDEARAIGVAAVQRALEEE